MKMRWAPILSLLMSVLVQLPSSFAQTSSTSIGPIGSPSSEQKPRRFIFLVHGLSGGVKTFGALPEVLKTHGAVIQPNTEFKIVPLSYNTGSGTEDTYDFAHTIGQEIIKEVGTLRPTDRITLIAHSQGGLVSWIWYLLSYSQVPEFQRYSQYATQTEGLMTLGSPMWGSKLATALAKYPKLGPLIQAQFQKHKMGPKELEEMSYSSNTILRFRNRAVALDRQKKNLPLRTYAVAGVLNSPASEDIPSYYRPLLAFAEEHLGSGKGHLTESDIAVSLPSARIDFIYLKDGAKSVSDEIRSEDFTFFNANNVRNFTIVKAPHMSWQQSVFYDIAEVPEICKEIQSPCSHPTYPLILAFTMACTPAVADCRANEFSKYVQIFQNDSWKARRMPEEVMPDNMHSFILDLVIDVPENYQLPNAEEVLSFLKFKGVEDQLIFNRENPTYYFVVDRKAEFKSHTVKVGSFKLNPPMSPWQKQIRVTLHGHVFEDKNGTNHNHQVYLDQAKLGFKLPLKIELPGLASRNVELLVRPTYTTYLNLDYTK
jgi:hypothetical protein